MKLSLSDISTPVRLELLARQLVEGFITGLHKSPYHGFSVEFAEHRLYNEGESVKHIDWRVYARTDRLFTKEFEEETNLRCLLVLDTSSSMYYPGDDHLKIRFAVYGAAALAYLLQRQRDAVGLCSFSTDVDLLTAVKSTPTHLKKLFTNLEAVINQAEPRRRTQVAPVLHAIAEKIHRRSLVIIFSDMFDAEENTEEVFKALQHLKHNKHEVIVFHVMDDKTELKFDFADRLTEFIDLESGEKIKLIPAQVKADYQQRVNAFHAALKLRCNQFKIDFVEVDVRDDFNLILQTYLIRRTKMR